MDISAVNPALRAATAKTPAIDLENGAVRWLAATASSLIPGKRVDGVTRRTLRHDGVKLRIYTPPQPSGAGLFVDARRRSRAGLGRDGRRALRRDGP
ncbi:hypothetical protein ACSBPH_07070 [Microbacterium sp. F51-2R]|jgi:hypothetical protein|uniref:hypothetical protein n=1 Tax=Microbacterium sp. F51-2R TaxID=3445777 RepID=UPI003FA03A7A